MDEVKKEEEVQDKLNQYEFMLSKIQQLEERVQNNDGAAQILSGMIERKEVVMDLNGNYVTEKQSDASILGSQYNE